MCRQFAVTIHRLRVCVSFFISGSGNLNFALSLNQPESLNLFMLDFRSTSMSHIGI